MLMPVSSVSDAEGEPCTVPPGHLSPEAQREWLRLTEEYDLDDPAARLILTTAFEAFDRMRGAQEQLAKDGVTFRDRWGKPRMHPAVTVERDARAAWLAALKQLNLDLEPLRDGPGRPPGTPMDGSVPPAGRLFDE